MAPGHVWIPEYYVSQMGVHFTPCSRQARNIRLWTPGSVGLYLAIEDVQRHLKAKAFVFVGWLGPSLLHTCPPRKLDS
jgi:hypothetical protein